MLPHPNTLMVLSDHRRRDLLAEVERDRRADVAIADATSAWQRIKRGLVMLVPPSRQAGAVRQPIPFPPPRLGPGADRADHADAPAPRPLRSAPRVLMLLVLVGGLLPLTTEVGGAIPTLPPSHPVPTPHAQAVAGEEMLGAALAEGVDGRQVLVLSRLTVPPAVSWEVAATTGVILVAVERGTLDVAVEAGTLRVARAAPLLEWEIRDIDSGGEVVLGPGDWLSIGRDDAITAHNAADASVVAIVSRLAPDAPPHLHKR